MEPDHKNKQQAFQAAQQGMKTIRRRFSQLVRDWSADYGQQFKTFKK